LFFPSLSLLGVYLGAYREIELWGIYATNSFADCRIEPARQVLPQGRRKGAYLEVFPNGSKLWRFKYRIDGKEKRLALGAYPETTLQDARDQRDARRKQVMDGIDPAREKRLNRLERKVCSPSAPRFGT